jgi:hypothetical protein
MHHKSEAGRFLAKRPAPKIEPAGSHDKVINGLSLKELQVPPKAIVRRLTGYRLSRFLMIEEALYG